MSAALTTNVDQRLLRTTKFPPEFNVKVDNRKINIHLIKSWAQTEIAKILNDDDDVVTELVSNILEESRYPNIKELQISLTGFLDKDAAPFCQNLWKLCISAQNNPQGIPKELIEAKKAELTQEKAEKEKAREEAIRRQETERERERELARIRDRERHDRERGRGGGRGGRGGRDFDRRPPRDSRSPPPPRRRRDDDDFRGARPRVDTYVPSASGRRRRSRSRSRERPASRSRSPPPRRRRRNSSSSRSSPPPSTRKRRNSSSGEESASPKRNHRPAKDKRASDHRRHRSRSPPRKRRSPSPRRDRRRHTSRSRSPPAKRTRRSSSSSHRASSSESPKSPASPPRRSKATTLAPDDLMANDRRRERSGRLRLSREPSLPASDRSRTPTANEHNNDRSRPVENEEGATPVSESDDRSKTLAAGAEDEDVAND